MLRPIEREAREYNSKKLLVPRAGNSATVQSPRKELPNMSNFKANQIREIIDKTGNIWSMSVIAQNDHEKFTLTDSFIFKVDVISAKQAGDARFTNTRADEQELGVTNKGQPDDKFF